MDVLNKRLYRQLGRRFGGIKLQNPGEAMICRAVRDNDDKPYLLIDHNGEYYRVCCPYCKDTRYRLYVNHRFGQQDSEGRELYFLATCFNENCLDTVENFKDFLDQLDNESIVTATVKQGVIVDEALREVSPPGPLIALSALRRNHPARAYIQSRGFDPEELENKFGVMYCQKSRYSFASNRLIIPVYEKDKLKGWQARYVGELDWKGPKKKELPPKYFNAPNAHFKSKVIFNWERMKNWYTGIIVEGPTDVFRMGSMSGCIFGNSMSELQKRKFAAVFRKRSGVLLLDPEEYESKQTAATLEYFRVKMPGQFCAVKLPKGTDPGSLGRDFLRAYVKQQAAKQGVTVKYKKVN